MSASENWPDHEVVSTEYLPARTKGRSGCVGERNLEEKAIGSGQRTIRKIQLIGTET
jgi:hypothetical protein